LLFARSDRVLDEELAIRWQDVLDEIAAGRSDNVVCPYCGHGPMTVAPVAAGQAGHMRISCPRCGQFIEGIFTNS